MNTSHGSLRSVLQISNEKTNGESCTPAEQSLMTFHQNTTKFWKLQRSPRAVAVYRGLPHSPNTLNTGFLSASFAFPPVHTHQVVEQDGQSKGVFREGSSNHRTPKGFAVESLLKLASIGEVDPEARELGR